MDQTVSLSQPASSSASSAPLSPLPAAASPSAAEEDPESPGRTPRHAVSPEISNDPLADGIALVLGVALALTTVVVPLATVLCDAQPSDTLGTVRAGW